MSKATKIISITIILLLAVIITAMAMQSRFKVIPSSLGTIHIRHGDEYGIFQYDPDLLVIENEGITFIDYNAKLKTVYAQSEKTGKKVLISLVANIIL